MNSAPITAVAMRELVTAGRGIAVLPDHFPVPVQLDGVWWHVPTTNAGNASPGEYVPAPPELAELLDQLQRRSQAAAQASARHPHPDHP